MRTSRVLLVLPVLVLALGALPAGFVPATGPVGSSFGALLPGLAPFFAPTPALAATESDGNAWLGVHLQELTGDLREALGISRRVEGALVSGVMEDSPAERAGIKNGDIIVKIDNRRVRSVDDAVKTVRDLDPGDKIPVEVNRNDTRRSFTVTLGSRAEQGEEEEMQSAPESNREVRKFILKRHHGEPDYRPGQGHHGEQERDEEEARPLHKRHHRRHYHHSSHGFLGVYTMELGEQLARYFQVPEDIGVLVTEVEPGSPADDAGLQAGDVILTVDGEEVEDSEDLRYLIRGHDPEETIPLEISRRGSRTEVEVQLGEAPDMREMWFPEPREMPPGFTPGERGDSRIFKFRIPNRGRDMDLESLKGLEFLRNLDFDELRDAIREHLRPEELRDAILRRLHRDRLDPNDPDDMEILRQLTPGDDMEMEIILRKPLHRPRKPLHRMLGDNDTAS